MLNGNKGMVDAGGLTASASLSPLAKGELVVGALKIDLGAGEAPGREKAGGGGFAVDPPSAAGVKVILGTAGGTEGRVSFSSSFLRLASRIRIIAFASRSCFSHLENCLYVRGLRMFVLSMRLGLGGAILLLLRGLLPPEVLRTAEAIRLLAAPLIVEASCCEALLGVSKGLS